MGCYRTGNGYGGKRSRVPTLGSIPSCEFYGPVAPELAVPYTACRFASLHGRTYVYITADGSKDILYSLWMMMIISPP